MDEPTDYDVVIVGAGFAGMYMLHRIRDFSAQIEITWQQPLRRDPAGIVEGHDRHILSHGTGKNPLQSELFKSAPVDQPCALQSRQRTRLENPASPFAAASLRIDIVKRDHALRSA